MTNEPDDRTPPAAADQADQVIESPSVTASVPSDPPAPQPAPPTPPMPPASQAPSPGAQATLPHPAAASRPDMSNYAPPTGRPVTDPTAQTLPRAYGSAYPSTPADTGSAGRPGGSATSVPAAEGGAAKRSPWVGLVAALAVGALVGGVSGAGVAAFAMNNGSSGGSAAVSGNPTNITVNDTENATAVTAVAAASGPSVVTLSVSDSGGAAGTGSGVILTEDGYLVTNTHVVTLDGASADPDVSVQTYDGRIFTASVVGTDPISDLAVVKIDGDATFQPADFADSSKLNVGDMTVAIGAPLGLANTVTDGIVSALNRSITVASSAVPDGQSEEAPDQNGEQGPFDFWQFDNGQNQQQQTASSTISLPVIQTDAAINPGNSGGALLDSDGKVIGINVAIASAGQSSGQSGSAAGSIGVGFAIPSNLAKRIADEIIDSGKGSHGLLGATVGDVTAETANVVGASIQSITEGGAAASGGLAKGDIITAINDIPVTGKTDLTAQVRALAAGSDAKIAYQRDGKAATVDVKLGSLE